ncbi:hypothetical protein KUTeg_009242 [Tegillarca granosa]|uniref:IgGFc-binding protein N-terminal domain-containing protein n=1 Tax=Tegillarca granosa TaxID=220873 RepID=A0ABQ9F751_TEGGR|nr:hypothetical protein KUTeg_009242 [Tegillarca granosa]
MADGPRTLFILLTETFDIHVDNYKLKTFIIPTERRDITQCIGYKQIPRIRRFKYLANMKMMIIFSQLRILEAGGPDNKGTEYIIGYMENKGTDYSADLYVTTMKTTTVTVNVKAPLYTNITIDEQFSITGGQVHKLSFDTRIRAVGDSLEDKGIWITADQEVVIYGVNPEKFSNEAFLGLPTDILGMDYYIITWYPPTEKCQLLIVGVTDSTTVTITLGEALDTYFVTWSGTNYTKGDSIIVNINRFQTLQLTSVGDLTGTQITSDKIIAVFSGNEKTKVGAGSSRDHLVEQWPPVSTLGKNFATVPMPGRTVGDLFKFVATEDNTQINVTGANYSASFTISLAGSHHQLDIPSGNDYYCYVQSDKPILMAQFCKSQESSDEKSDPSMVMIPPIELYSADYTFSTPEYSDIGNYTNYFMFVAKDADKSGLLLDGGPFPGTVEYNPIPGTDLVGGHVEVSHGTHTVRHTSVISVFGGYVFGTANFETYAFVSGSRLAPINTVCVPTTTVIGDLYDNDCDGLIDEELCPNLADEDGDGSVDEDCAMPFPVDGNWTDWTAWSECSVTCSADGSLVSGFTERTRNCSNPAPQYDGRQCEGHENETNTCSTSSYCPVDGNWTDWSAWSSCSVTCKKDENEANGTIIRTRNCSEPVPQYGGNECVGEGNETLICSTTFYCPVHGNWTDWSSWSICSVTCLSNGGEESGTSLRSRSCNDPAPQYNGTDCDGNSTESTSCSTSTECPKDTSGTDHMNTLMIIKLSNISSQLLIIYF